MLPVLFSELWFLLHTFAPSDGSEAYAVSLMSVKTKTQRVECDLVFKQFYSEAEWMVVPLWARQVEVTRMFCPERSLADGF